MQEYEFTGANREGAESVPGPKTDCNPTLRGQGATAAEVRGTENAAHYCRIPRGRRNVLVICLCRAAPAFALRGTGHASQWSFEAPEKIGFQHLELLLCSFNWAIEAVHQLISLSQSDAAPQLLVLLLRLNGTSEPPVIMSPFRARTGSRRRSSLRSSSCLLTPGREGKALLSKLFFNMILKHRFLHI